VQLLNDFLASFTSTISYRVEERKSEMQTFESEVDFYACKIMQ
jgi:hypothetical protein